MSPGQINSGTLIIKNNSNYIWYNDDSKPGGIQAGSMRLVTSGPYYRGSLFSNPGDPSWLSNSQIKMQTPIVRPGENATFTFTWKAPLQPGKYTERFALVLDGYALLPDIGMQISTTVQ